MILLDTHALLWWIADPKRLSPAAAAAITDDASVYVSPISFWELAMLAERGRVIFDRDVQRWCRDVLAKPEMAVADLTPSAAVAAARLPQFHGDPADRFIYATAQEMALPLVTEDATIRAYARIHRNLMVIW